MKTFILLLCCYIITTHGQTNVSTQVVKLSTGVQLKELPKTFYESSANLVYSVDLPQFHNFLLNHTCIGNDDSCEAYGHIKRLINDTLEILEYSLPNIDDFSTSEAGKTKRGIDMIGNVLGWCCSVAHQNDLNELAQEEGDLTKIVNNLKDQVAQEHANVIQAETLTNKYSEQLSVYLNEMNKENKNRLTTIAKISNEIEKRVTNLEDISSLIAKTQFRSVIATAWLKVINSCTDRRVPYFLVKPQTLKEDLSQIEKQINELGYGLSIRPEKYHAYYGLETTSCHFSEKKLIIRVKLPMKEIKNNYKLFTVTTLPFSYENTICSVDTDIEYIVYKNQKDIFPLRGHSAMECVSLHSSLCHVSRYHTDIMHHNKCIKALLSKLSSVKTIKEACSFTCTAYDGTPIILEISSPRFAIINPGKEIRITCNNKTTQVHKIKDQTGIFELDLSCSCFAEVGQERITPTIPCSNQNTEFSLQHSIHASWANDDVDKLLVSRHSYFENISTIINHGWDEKVPNLKLNSKPLPMYTIPAHIEHGSLLSYFIAGVVAFLLIAIIVIFLKFKTLNPVSLTSAVAALLMQQVNPATSFPLSTELTLIAMEGFQAFLLSIIAISSIILLIMLHKSKILKLFSSHEFTHGRVKVTTVDKNNPKIKATAFRQSFRKIAKKSKTAKKSDDSNVLELTELLRKQKK